MQTRRRCDFFSNRSNRRSVAAVGVLSTSVSTQNDRNSELENLRGNGSECEFGASLNVMRKSEASNKKKIKRG